MGQLMARRSLLYFLLFCTGYDDLRGRNVKSHPCFLGHRNVVKMPPSVREGALSSEALFCLWALFSH